MVTVRDICGYMNEAAPFYTKFDFDNIGLLVGFPERPVRRVLTALDITDEVRPGKNDFERVLLSSRRNVFGPFYGYDKSPVWCNSDRFKVFQITDRQLVKVGLETPPVIYYVKNR